VRESREPPQKAMTLVPITSPYFAKGYHIGRVWYFHGREDVPVDDLYLISTIAYYCEKGMHLHPEWLAERVGFLMGMVSAELIPEEK
jgi:hypothetical protein